MAVALTEDQACIRDSARDFLRGEADFDRLRKTVDGAEGWDRALWQSFAGEMGFAGLGVSEALGGSGLGVVELGLVAEQLGQVLAPIPWFESAVFAAGLIAEAGSEAQQARWLPRIASGEIVASVAMHAADGRALCLPGEAHYVTFGAVADLLVVLHDDGIGLVRTDGLDVAADVTMDLTRPYAHVRLSDVEPMPGDPAPALGRAAAVLACESVGGMQRTLDETVAYSLQRVQFGRPIGSFQAMKHRMADMKLRLEACRSAAAWAIDAAATQAEGWQTAASAALAYCADAYLALAGEGIQLHGGIGFTWEHHAHLFFKRARSTATLLGAPAEHREKIACALLDIAA